MKRGCLYDYVTAAGKGQKVSLLSPRAFSYLTTEPGAGQGIPYPGRGAHWASDAVYSSCVRFWSA